MQHVKALNNYTTKTVSTLKRYHEEYLIRKRKENHHRASLTEHLSSPSPSSNQYDVYCLQEEFIVDNDNTRIVDNDNISVRIVRVFIRGPDSGEYKTCGWIVSQCIATCMICKKTLQTMFTNDSHHCRACGNIICSDCSQDNASIVHEIKEAGEQRICVMCFWGQEELVHAQNNYKGIIDSDDIVVMGDSDTNAGDTNADDTNGDNINGDDTNANANDANTDANANDTNDTNDTNADSKTTKRSSIWKPFNNNNDDNISDDASTAASMIESMISSSNDASINEVPKPPKPSRNIHTAVNFNIPSTPITNASNTVATTASTIVSNKISTIASTDDNNNDTKVRFVPSTKTGSKTSSSNTSTTFTRPMVIDNSANNSGSYSGISSDTLISTYPVSPAMVLKTKVITNNDEVGPKMFINVCSCSRVAPRKSRNETFKILFRAVNITQGKCGNNGYVIDVIVNSKELNILMTSAVSSSSSAAAPSTISTSSVLLSLQALISSSSSSLSPLPPLQTLKPPPSTELYKLCAFIIDEVSASCKLNLDADFKVLRLKGNYKGGTGNDTAPKSLELEGNSFLDIVHNTDSDDSDDDNDDNDDVIIDIDDINTTTKNDASMWQRLSLPTIPLLLLIIVLLIIIIILVSVSLEKH